MPVPCAKRRCGAGSGVGTYRSLGDAVGGDLGVIARLARAWHRTRTSGISVRAWALGSGVGVRQGAWAVGAGVRQDMVSLIMSRKGIHDGAPQ